MLEKSSILASGASEGASEAGEQTGENSHVSLSLRAFAKKIGVSDTAVRKAIRAGRLGDAVAVDGQGRPFIANPELAAGRWHDTSKTGVGASRKPSRARSQGSHGATECEPSASPGSLVEAQRQATAERARKLRLENDTKERQLVPVGKVKREAFERMRLVRESMLNIPARIAGELAADTDAAVVFRKLDAAIREALASTADALEATVH